MKWSHAERGNKHVILSYDIKVVENSDGHWVPSVITAYEHPGLNVTNKTVLTYSDVRVHEEILC